MANSKPLVVSAIAVVLAVAVGYTTYRSQQKASALAPSIAPASLARLQATSLPEPDGKMRTISDWKGKVLVVNFWATWCPPCRKEMPAFSRLHDKLAAKGVQFVGIGIDSPSAIKEYVLQSPVSYAILIGGSEGLELTRALGNVTGALPHTVVIGRDGEPVFSRLGLVDEGQLEALLTPLVGR